ncbi:MAG: hypothetical protein A2138_11235 [Deltaproteobacteria bacterium RBG_16_71_12]|nr:MAG: hypothetical protein A2138_11235 [Deltaproteobacteria bacterium RBG_16_71_12]
MTSHPLVLASTFLLLSGAVCAPPPPDPCADPDQDGDGSEAIACGGDDCDDLDAARAPGMFEVCDAADHDEDCNQATFGVRDTDGDGALDAGCRNVGDDGAIASSGDDCDDARRDVHPSQAEVCDGRDNDCDGEVDDGVLITLYRDADGDGHGDPLADTLAWCTLAAGYAFVADDCDDVRDDIHPGASELCDDADNNCDGDTDEDARLVLYVDEDDDGFGTSATIEACTAGPGRAPLPGDCDDANPALVNGSMRCIDMYQYQICQDGTWSVAATCPSQQCQEQPNGVGICR